MVATAVSQVRDVGVAFYFSMPMVEDFLVAGRVEDRWSPRRATTKSTARFAGWPRNTILTSLAAATARCS